MAVPQSAAPAAAVIEPRPPRPFGIGPVLPLAPRWPQPPMHPHREPRTFAPRFAHDKVREVIYAEAGMLARRDLSSPRAGCPGEHRARRTAGWLTKRWPRSCMRQQCAGAHLCHSDGARCHCGLAACAGDCTSVGLERGSRRPARATSQGGRHPGVLSRAPATTATTWGRRSRAGRGSAGAAGVTYSSISSRCAGGGWMCRPTAGGRPKPSPWPGGESYGTCVPSGRVSGKVCAQRHTPEKSGPGPRLVHAPQG